MIRRGELRWADLPASTGSEPGWPRPVLIVSADVYNESRIRTVLVAVITSNLELGRIGANVTIAASTSGLRRDSVVNVGQIVTMDKRQLGATIGSLPSWELDQVDAGLATALGLPAA